MVSHHKSILLALFEATLLFAFIVWLDYAFPNLSFLSLSPNPFWFPVILISLQFGRYPGLLAAFAAIGLAYSLGAPEQGLSDDLFVHYLRIWSEPVAWIVSAFLIGGLRSRQMLQHSQTMAQLARLSKERQVVADHSAEIEKTIEKLERQYALQERQSPDELFRHLTQLQKMGAADWPDEIVGNIFEYLLGTRSYLIFSNEKNGLRQVAPTSQVQASKKSLPNNLLDLIDNRDYIRLANPQIREMGSPFEADVTLQLRSSDGQLQGILVLENMEMRDEQDRFYLLLDLVSIAIANALATRHRQEPNEMSNLITIE